MSEIKPAFAQATGKNIWSFPTVRNRDGTRKFLQEEIAYSELNSQIYEWTQEALKRSGSSIADFSEVGFLVAELNGGALEHEFVTSNDQGDIFPEDLDKAHDKLFQRVDHTQVKRIQLYHPHPPGGPAVLQLSMGDVNEAIRLQQRGKDQGVNVPFDMHAMPYDIAYEGMFKKFTRPPIGGGEAQEDSCYVVSEPVLVRMSVDVA